MPEVKVRKFLVSVEEIHHEGGPPAAVPPKRGVILAVVENPYAGAFHENILPFMDDLKPLGLEMARRLLAAGSLGPGNERGHRARTDRATRSRSRRRSSRRCAGAFR